MSLAPLLEASLAIKLHAASAVAALLLGIVQLTAPKGTLPHRAIGYVWLALMVAIATSSFFIHEIRQLGPFSVIHLLSAYTLVMLPVGILLARRGDIARHRWLMTQMFYGALVVAGLFTLVPGRILGRAIFGW